jgi:hypothetical protein
VENVIKINTSKCTEIRFTRARGENQVVYSVDEQKIPETTSCKYLRIFLQSVLTLVDQVNYRTKKPGGHYTLYCVFSEKEIGNKNLVYTSSVRPFLEYVSKSWDPYRGR